MQNPPNNYPPNGPFYPSQQPNYPPNQSSSSYPPQPNTSYPPQQRPGGPFTPPPGQGGWQQMPPQQQPSPSGSYAGPPPWSGQQTPSGPGWQTQTPPPYPPTPGQMPNGMPPQPPRKKSRKKLWITLAVIFVVLGIIGAITNGNSGTQSPTASSTQAAQATSAPATPTATSKPQPTLTPSQRVAQLVQANATLDDKVESKFDSSGVVVTETLSEAFDNAGYRTGMQSNCFDIEKALWQSGIKNLKDVEVNFLGPLIDAYGNKSEGAIGLCELTTPTEAKFNWGNLDAQQAWQDYDNAYFSSAVQG